MGQQEVYDFLKSREGEWFTRQEIAKGTGNTIRSVSGAIMRLRKHRSISYKHNDRTNNGFEYSFAEMGRGFFGKENRLERVMPLRGRQYI